MNKKRALLVIDVQNEYITGALQVTYPSGSLNNIVKAIHTAKEANIQIIIVQHTSIDEMHTFVKGSKAWELHDEIKKFTPDFFIEKHYPSAFAHTELESYLRENGINTIAICGYATQVCCDTTARYGMHLGFDIEFLYDATATLGLKTATYSVSAQELFETAVATQGTVFSKVMRVEEWNKVILKSQS